MLHKKESLFREFASKEYIEKLASLLSGLEFSKGTLFQDTLRKLLPVNRKHELRCYYDGHDSLFKELANALAAINPGNIDEAAARDLAIEITKFLICFPENCRITEEASPSFLKKLSARFPSIQKAVIGALAEGAGFYGDSWTKTNTELEKIISDTSQKIHYLVNIIGETFSALAGIELSPEEINEIIESVSSGVQTSETIFEKIRNAVLTGSPVSVYRNPYQFISQPGVIGYRFYASRGRRRNKGRVYMKKCKENDKEYLDIPIATPTHNYDEKMIEDRLEWMSRHLRVG